MQEITMTEREKAIYQGLKIIGPEISAFFYDGLRLLQDEYEIQPYLLAHISREIEGGLRDILCPKSKIIICSKCNQEIKEKKICQKCNKEIHKKEDHKISILKALELSEENTNYIVNKWKNTAEKFNIYAHRHGPWKNLRSKDVFKEYWESFVEILEYLVGSNYSIYDRIDTIMKKDPSLNNVIDSISEILKNPITYKYFFNNLKSSKWLKELYDAGYFKGSLNPETYEAEDKSGSYHIPYWEVLEYIKKVAIDNLEKPNKDISQTLDKIFDDISGYRKDDGTRIENSWTDYNLFLIICNLPEEYLTEKHFIFITVALKSKWQGAIEQISYYFEKLIERLLIINNKELLIRCIKIILEHKYEENNSYEKLQSIFKGYNLIDILDKYKTKLIDVCGNELLEISINKLEEVISLVPGSFYTLSAIENHSQTSCPDNYYCQVTYLIRDCLEVLPKNVIRPKLEYFLNHKEAFFKRFVFHTIRIRYEEFNDLFWNIDKNPLDIMDTKHEVYELIKEHSKHFEKEKINTILEWVEKNNYFIPEEIKDEQEKTNVHLAYYKKEWITALLDINNDDVKKYYNELNKINDSTFEFPGFRSYHKSYVGNPSSLTVEEVSKMEINEFIDYLNEYSKTEQDFFEGTLEGLDDQFEYAVKDNPEKYSINCSSIINANSHTQYSWITGLMYALQDNKKSFKCDDVFSIVLQIINSDKFWIEHNTNDEYKKWFISSLLSFIERLLEIDNNSFDFELMNVIRRTLFIIFKKEKHKLFDYHDIVSAVLNDITGKLFNSMFLLLFKKAYYEENNIKWDNDIKEIITNNLNSNVDNELFYYLIGEYLPKLKSLDECWVNENFKIIFPNNNLSNWLACFSGFLDHYQPNIEYLKLFIDNGYYEKFIFNNSEKIIPRIKNYAIECILYTFLNDIYNINIKSNILQLLLKTNEEQIFQKIVHFLHFYDIEIDKINLSNKIKLFWNEVYQNCNNDIKNDLDKFKLSECCKLINNVPCIDTEIFEWIKTGIQFMDDKAKTDFIYNTKIHFDNNTKEIGLLYVDILNSGFNYPIYQKELKELVEVLYQKEFKSIADNLCNIIAKYDTNYLRDIYIKYNNFQ